MRKWDKVETETPERPTELISYVDLGRDGRGFFRATPGSSRLPSSLVRQPIPFDYRCSGVGV